MSRGSRPQGDASLVVPAVDDRPGLLRPLRRHPLIWFFVLAYAGFWIYDALYIVYLKPIFGMPDSWPAPGVLLGPTAAAFIMSAVVGGRAGVVALLRRYVQWRAGVQWYLLV